MSWNYPYFTEKEMSCNCGCGGLPQDSFMQILVTMREEAGFPFIISSGYRCPVYNSQVSDSGFTGPHTLGLAADVRLYGERALKFIAIALKHGMTGIGVGQKGEFRSRYIHTDCVKPGGSYPRPTIWSY